MDFEGSFGMDFAYRYILLENYDNFSRLGNDAKD